ncbi:PRD domain-containing protein [Clostridium folliculivorans]|uniref:PRD domain-containing protein n=1 Tax=Clostridium folliculivorans TaxID=2886038 RepID=UPI0021C37502|nr:PRD domain-containing protein [Clostridium folliculivorans]GKU30367.1 ATPase AAA [Clostridium folliculivorans]
MKSNREQIIDFMIKCSNSVNSEEAKGVSTQYLSNRLGMQRTNISSILNELVKDGVVEKVNGRPVLYRIKKKTLTPQGEQSCFKQLIGCNGSLKNAVQLAKAAILYPQHSLHSLVLGPNGSGKSYFVNLMYYFAKENKIIENEAPFIRFNCNNYSDKPEQMVEILFGIDKGSFLSRAKGGVLFIDHIELLPAEGRNILIRLIENNYVEVNGIKSEFNAIIICAINDIAKQSLIDYYSSYFSIRIQLPSLAERNLNERFELIKHFFTIEAARCNKTLNINSELLICLLLYQCETNVKQLNRDIQIGCANAYVREFENNKDNISILMSDFPFYVRSGFLNFKRYKSEIKEIISENCNYAFSKIEATMISLSEEKLNKKKNMYDFIDEKVNELRERGIEEQDINTIISIDVENQFKKYSKKLMNQVVNEEQLSEIVNSRVISLVKDFLNEATKKFNKVYPHAIFYGLCLHLNSTLNRKDKFQRLSNEQIMEVIGKYHEEYSYCVKFVSLIEKEFAKRLPIDEVVFITMFITRDSLEKEENKYPVVLLALHGNTAASSLVEVINNMGSNETYAYDMPLNKSTNVAYEELKTLIIKIHQGKGVFVIYDMGSFATMLDMISSETGIEIRKLEIPITLLALDCNRKIMLGMEIDEIHKGLINTYNNMMCMQENVYYRAKSKKVVLTLCMSGEGAAVQIKNYIINNIKPQDIEIIPLAITDKQFLLEEVNRIKENHNIICVIGSYNPQLMGIRYLPITDIFQNNAKELRGLLNLGNEDIDDDEEGDDFKVIFDHLSKELELVDVDKLRVYLPKVIGEIGVNENYHLTEEQELALMVHIACCIEYMLKKVPMSSNIHKENILNENKELYNSIKKSFSVIEKEFDVTFSDNELANIISIMKMSQKG